MTWRRHRVALEFERPMELELKHRVAQVTDLRTGRVGAELTVLHLAANRDIFVTKRRLHAGGDGYGHHSHRHAA